MLRVVVSIVSNLILAGFFGLACAFGNLLWLEWIIHYCPAVSYTMTYQMYFGGGCAIGYIVMLLVRMYQSRLDTLYPKGMDIIMLCVFIVIAMLVCTPVPHSNFLKYVMERNAVVHTNAAPTMLNTK